MPIAPVRMLQTASNQNATKIALHKKGAIISDNEKFGIREIPAVWRCQQRPCFFFLSTVTVLSSLPIQLLTSGKGPCLPKYLFLEATKTFPRKFPHLGKFPVLSHWPDLPHMGLLLLKHTEGTYQTVQLERTRREAENWGKSLLTRQLTSSAKPVYAQDIQGVEQNMKLESEWVVLMYYQESICMK